MSFTFCIIAILIGLSVLFMKQYKEFEYMKCKYQRAKKRNAKLRFIRTLMNLGLPVDMHQYDYMVAKWEIEDRVEELRSKVKIGR